MTNENISIDEGIGSDESDDLVDSLPLELLKVDDEDFYDNYTIQEQLQKGLVATVKRCINQKTGRACAVKLVDVSTETQHADDAERNRSETRNETILLRKLNHRNIIKFVEYYESPSTLFVVLELAPLGDLFSNVGCRLFFEQRNIRRIARQLFDGVSYLHRNRIVHRDIKLENILCMSDRHIVIGDFGFAVELISDDQRLFEYIGTIQYMAPELLKCELENNRTGYGREVDIWACGVVLYTMLAGYEPFNASTTARRKRLIKFGSPQFNADTWSGIAPDAKHLIEKILVVDIQKRYTVADCLKHRWIVGGIKSKTKKSTNIHLSTTITTNRRFRRLIIAIRFVVCLRLIIIKRSIDRQRLRQRPYDDVGIRHQAQTIVSSIYEHWVNRGYHFTRNELFANRPKPRRHHRPNVIHPN